MERNVQEEQCYKILEVKIRFLNQKNVEKSRDESFREDSPKNERCLWTKKNAPMGAMKS